MENANKAPYLTDAQRREQLNQLREQGALWEESDDE